jgi:DNA-binding NarL/FixJ family response regulator
MRVIRRTEAPVSVVRIAVISDDRLFCEGIVSILHTVTSFEVVERGTPADVVMIDSRLEDALAICERLQESAAALMTAAPSDPEWCRDALCAGASGVLSKNAGAGELVQAVRVLAAGSVWAPRRAMAACIKHLLSGVLARRAGSAMLEQQLSRREREILRQAATGLANKELASRFEIGEATVKAHLTRIFQKLGVRGRAELAAVYHGAVPSPIVARPKSNGTRTAKPRNEGSLAGGVGPLLRR